MLDRAATNDAIVTRYLEDPEFREVVNEQLARAIYAELAAEDMSLSPAPGEGVPAPDEGSAR